MRGRALAIALLLIGVGCGGDDVSRSSFPGDVADATCDLLAECGCEEVPPDACESQARLLWDMLDDSAAEAGLSFDAACAAIAVDALSSSTCDMGQATAPDPPDEPCKIYFGPDAVGEPCQNIDLFFDSCTRGAFCLGGTCVDVTNLPGEGDSCADGNVIFNCQEGLTCNVSFDGAGQATGVCEPLATLGQSCEDNDCEETLDCFGELGSRTCVAAHAQGEECNDVCGEGLYCDGDPRVCQPLKADGETCDRSDECLSDNCDATCQPRDACELSIDFGQ